jgi:hypothetical protein
VSGIKLLLGFKNKENSFKYYILERERIIGEITGSNLGNLLGKFLGFHPVLLCI